MGLRAGQAARCRRFCSWDSCLEPFTAVCTADLSSQTGFTFRAWILSWSDLFACQGSRLDCVCAVIPTCGFAQLLLSPSAHHPEIVPAPVSAWAAACLHRRNWSFSPWHASQCLLWSAEGELTGKRIWGSLGRRGCVCKGQDAIMQKGFLVHQSVLPYYSLVWNQKEPLTCAGY